jgi:hypothetical protein
VPQSDDEEDEDDAAAFEAYKAQRIAFVQNSLSANLTPFQCSMRYALRPACTSPLPCQRCLLTFPFVCLFVCALAFSPRFGVHTRVSKLEFANLVKEVHELVYVVCHIYQNVRLFRRGHATNLRGIVLVQRCALPELSLRGSSVWLTLDFAFGMFCMSFLFIL